MELPADSLSIGRGFVTMDGAIFLPQLKEWL